MATSGGVLPSQSVDENIEGISRAVQDPHAKMPTRVPPSQEACRVPSVLSSGKPAWDVLGPMGGV